MQSLQATFLDNMQLGTTPVFIISATADEGSLLAALLSTHFTTEKKFAGHHGNYFTNHDIQRLLPRLKNATPEKIAEYQASVKFVVENGMDTGEIWGLQFEYKVFFDLALEDIFPNALFIFIYGGDSKDDISQNAYIRSILHFQENNKPRTVLLHLANVISTPATLLKSLPLTGMQIKDVAFEEYKNALSLHSGDIQAAPLMNAIHESNILNKKDLWFNGNDILAIFLINEHTNKDVLLNKILQFKKSFLSAPQFRLLCKTEKEKYFVREIINGSSFAADNIVVRASGDNFSSLFNEVISTSNCSYIIIDQLNLFYAVEHILAPYKQQPIAPVFVYGNLISSHLNENQISDKVSIADILVSRSLPDSISFSKASWQEHNGFDTTIPGKITILDFAIKNLRNGEHFAAEIKTEIAHVEASGEIMDVNVISEADYSIIIRNHRELVERNLNAVIKAAAVHQYLPHHEILKLSKKVSTLDSMLSHSYEQVKILNGMKSELQERITNIENKWYYKLAKRLAHFKNIFFKSKGSSKSGGLLKTFKFIIFMLTKPGFRIVRKIVKAGFRKLYLVFEDRPVRIIYLDNTTEVIAAQQHGENYHEWMTRKLDMARLTEDFNNTIGQLSVKPKISIILPVYNPPIEYLKKAVESVLDQLYENWELCISDDNSHDPQIKRLLTVYAARDNRIKVIFRERNGHISANSNSALSLATGDFVALLDHDDLLTPNSLFEVAKYINEHPGVQFLYSDEDKIDDNGTLSSPYFKPDWSPDKLLANNYITHLAVIDRSLIEKVHGFREGFEGSQDYDLFLRIVEHTDKIGHIPKVLYHWRIHQASVASEGDFAKPYAYIAGKKALEEALIRRKTPGTIQYSRLRGTYQVVYEVKAYEKVSIIIPTKDQVLLMKNTIDSIIELTDYPDYEIIVLNNNSSTKEFFDLMKEYTVKYGDIFRCIDATFPFNFAKLMNVGVSVSNGAYVLMLNNDVEILQKDWITRMVSFAQQKRIGVVGVRLLYPDDHIQHAGTIVGLGGVAGHLLVGVHKDNPGYYGCLHLTSNYAAVTAACMMCRKETYEELDGMDELLEVEYNDVDFCLKFTDAGYYNVFMPDVTLYHYESVSRGHPHQTKASYERHVREVAYFKKKWEKYICNDPYYNPNLSYDSADFRINYNA
jgi:glycosyltransferase involved in cell wall biosynthesis